MPTKKQGQRNNGEQPLQNSAQVPHWKKPVGVGLTEMLAVTLKHMSKRSEKTKEKSRKSCEQETLLPSAVQKLLGKIGGALHVTRASAGIFENLKKIRNVSVFIHFSGQMNQKMMPVLLLSCGALRNVFKLRMLSVNATCVFRLSITPRVISWAINVFHSFLGQQKLEKESRLQAFVVTLWVLYLEKVLCGFLLAAK